MPHLMFENGTPVSGVFSDVYFSRAGGMAEVQHVFLDGNELPGGFARHPNFTVGELGFGTGLNFLVTWKAFIENTPAHHHLHYLAVEKFPLTPAMLEESLAAFPELADYRQALIAAYPLRLPGFHRMHFSRVTLTLGFGDAEELLGQQQAKVHAWYLDGFSPQKNTQMWSDALLAQVARLSSPGARLATFTSAGHVRRALAQVGFAVRKVPGFGTKREMSVARYAVENVAPAPEAASPTMLVIGGGIAGCTVAHALAVRGWSVTLLERDGVAAGASGNEGGVLFPQLTKRWNLSTAWYATAYGFMLRQMAHWKAQGCVFESAEVGMLRLPRHAEEEAQLRALNETLGLDPHIVRWIERDTAQQISGVPLTTGAAYFLRGSWLNPRQLCDALLRHPNITLHGQRPVVSLERTHHQWRATTNNDEVFLGTHVCIANASDAVNLVPNAGLKLNAVAGQISAIHAADVAVPLRSILCHKGYVIPAQNHYLIGATYNRGENALEVTAANHAENIAAVQQFLPGWSSDAPYVGRTSLRATTPDRLPYIGQIEPGLWISAGHGSRGLLSAPLAAEIIASALAGEPQPVDAALIHAMRPQRFT